MVWSRQLQTEIVLPSDVTPGPNSGAFYIGPNLPAEMLALGYTSAIIWYSDEADLDNSGVVYQYIGYRPATTSIAIPVMEVVHGMKRNNHDIEEMQIWQGSQNLYTDPYVEIDAQLRVINVDMSGDTDTLIVQSGSLVQSRTNSVNNESMALEYNSNNGEFSIGYTPPGGSTQQSDVRFFVITNPSIKRSVLIVENTDPASFDLLSQIMLQTTDINSTITATAATTTATLDVESDQSWLTDNTSIDNWNQDTRVSTVDGKTCTVVAYWRMTYDRIVDLKGSIVFSAAPSTQVLTIPLPIGVPTPEKAFIGSTATPAGLQINSGGSTRTPIGGFLDDSGNILMRGPATTAPGSTLYFWLMYSTSKPGKS